MGRGKPGSWGQGCLGAWDQIFCLARGGFITGCRTFEGGPPERPVPRKSGLPWGEVATGPNAWPGTSPPFPPREPGSPPSGHSKLCLPSLPSARHSQMVSGALSLLILKTSLQSRYYFNLHFTDGKVRTREVKWPGQGHPAREIHNQDSSPGRLAPEPKAMTPRPPPFSSLLNPVFISCCVYQLLFIASHMPGKVLGKLWFILFSLHNHLTSKAHEPHFTDEDAEGERRDMTDLRSLSL